VTFTPFDVAPHGRAALLCPEQEGVIPVEPRRRDDQFGVECDEALRRCGEVGLLEQLGADDLQQHPPLVVGLRRDDQYLGAEFREGVRHREAGDAQAVHGDPQAAPVVVPAGQGGQALRQGTVVGIAHVASHSR
jgi:hypothetical protein